jgi:hypothetical protein
LKRNTKLALALLLLAALILIHQYLAYGVIWQMSDFLHHETFAGMLIFGALIILLLNRGGSP